MKPRQKRIAFIALAAIGVVIASILVITGLRDGIGVSYFYSPTKVANGEAPTDQVIRIGGLVKEGSIKRVGDGLEVRFFITDNAVDIETSYTGILPDLFKEGKGVVARGRLGPNNLFMAEEVLAKHDENYLPPEAAEALEEARNAGVTKMQEKTQ